LLEDGIPDEETTRRVIEGFASSTGPHHPTLWIALAGSQLGVGRLEEHVRDRVLEIIDSGYAIRSWLADQGYEEVPDQLPPPAGLVSRRRAALVKLRTRLVGPQPAPKRIRKPRQHVTDLVPGDVLSYTVGREIALFRVVRIDHDRTGSVPVVAWLAWEGNEVPDVKVISQLAVRVQDDFDLAQYEMPSAPRPLIDRLLTPTSNGGDWRATGFVLVTRVVPAPEDESLESWGGRHWENLAFDVTHRLSRAR
jgi:hypothetical protein